MVVLMKKKGTTLTPRDGLALKKVTRSQVPN
jgi:hypothetical protein